MKFDALSLSYAGDKYLGTPYSEMDCQEFVERCLRDIGAAADLRGSNAWYRKCQAEGWVGPPEECVKIFGSVPKGAFLFIHAFDGGEKKRGYHDGLGNASHIGLKTGRGKGAIHSSSSRKKVAESEFHDKTIRNGGWNQVGLWSRMDYGKAINWLLDHMSIGDKPGENQQEGDKGMQAIAKSENGRVINFRKNPDKSAALVDQVPSGSLVTVLEPGEEWTKISWNGRTGWMMSQFLEEEDGAQDDFNAGDLDDDQNGSETVTLTFTVEELSMLLPVLESMVDQIVAKVGRG